jgi:hypothetical protein
MMANAENRKSAYGYMIFLGRQPDRQGIAGHQIAQGYPVDRAFL